jgi:hypothetical protein
VWACETKLIPSKSDFFGSKQTLDVPSSHRIPFFVILTEKVNENENN